MAILSCPLPPPATDRSLLAHGGGGRLTNQLIESVFLSAFSNPVLNSRHDGAVLAANGVRLAMTTDTYVVHPLVFPGGTIGDLAVNGTVNDLAMCGARPVALSAGFVLEEGLAMETLRTVVASMQAAAQVANVPIVTGDGAAHPQHLLTPSAARPTRENQRVGHPVHLSSDEIGRPGQPPNAR